MSQDPKTFPHRWADVSGYTRVCSTCQLRRQWAGVVGRRSLYRWTTAAGVVIGGDSHRAPVGCVRPGA